MGIAETDFAHWADLSSSIDWMNVRSVCDLGQQELYTSNSDAMLRHMKSFVAVASEDPSVNVEQIIKERWIRDIWRHLGRKITSIDVVGSGEDYLRLDLNEEGVPSEHRERYDFVTNCGTTEHVANQYNSFKIIHDLTRPGGYMYHCLPCGGMTSHGFFSYNIKFFELLALANGYQFLDAFVTVSPTPEPMDDHSQSLLRQDKAFLMGGTHGGADHVARDFRATAAGVRVCMRKPMDGRPFKPPLDIRAENTDVYGQQVS